MVLTGYGGFRDISRVETAATSAYGRPQTASCRTALGANLELTDQIFELLDMRSFSNLWYWIALAVTWSSASHWILGVPFDMLIRARRHGGQAEADLQDIVRVNVNRILYIADSAGFALTILVSCILTVLFMTGLFYGNEFCQAVFLLAFPLSLVGLLSVSTARKLAQKPLVGEALRKQLMRHRFWVQAIGMLSIFITAMWGMWQNLNIGALTG